MLNDNKPLEVATKKVNGNFIAHILAGGTMLTGGAAYFVFNSANQLIALIGPGTVESLGPVVTKAIPLLIAMGGIGWEYVNIKRARPTLPDPREFHNVVEDPNRREGPWRV